MRLSTAAAVAICVPMSAADPVSAAEDRLLDAAVRLAPTLGWGGRLVEAAARDAGVGAGELRLLLPRGAEDLAALLWRRHDATALATLAAVDARALKVRVRIRTAVAARVEAAVVDGVADRRAAAFLALPTHAPLALRLAWGAADGLWRWAGDTATDENHYSKRAILAGVLLSTAAVRAASGREAAERHLDRAIDGVMRFETLKARLPSPGALAQGAAAALGRLRYGAR